MTSTLVPVSCGGKLAQPAPDPVPEPDATAIDFEGVGGAGALDAGGGVWIDPIGMAGAAGSAMVIPEDDHYGGGLCE